MKEIIKDVWYANQLRVLSSSVLCAYDAKGFIQLEDRKMVFFGDSIEVAFNKNCKVYIGRQRFKWYTWALALAIIVPAYCVSCWGIAMMFGRMVAEAFLCVCVLCVVAGVGLGFSMKWVVVETAHEGGVIEKHYFFDGGVNGWRGIFLGSSRLYGKINDWMSRGTTGAG